VSPGAPGAPALELGAIDKRFGAVQANRAVSLTVAPGTIQGLIGENGAGKSTLMAIACGDLRPDRGTIRVKGIEHRFTGPAQAQAAGIGMVHQHFQLVERFTALENIILGREGGWHLKRGRQRALAALAQLQRDHGLTVPLETPVGELPVGLRQRVEILKALYRQAELLILDEPTAVLTPAEADHLFEILRALRQRGRAMVIVSHKLREIMALTDRVTVMRQGAVVADLATSATSADQLAEAMVGQRLVQAEAKAPYQPGAPVLTVESLRLTDPGGRALVEHLDLTVHAGEIVGVAGVAGNGQSELLEALAGLRPPTAGTIAVAGTVVARAGHPTDPRSLRRLGVAHVPEDRGRLGLVGGFSAAESAILGYQDDPAYRRHGLLSPRAIRAACRRLMARFDIRPAEPDHPSSAFSGGNQQKLVLGREVERQPRLLLVGQPTRGVDIGAVALIHRQLLALRDQGAAILLISADLDEILALADRIVVMAGGRLSAPLAAGAASERQLGLLMAG